MSRDDPGFLEDGRIDDTLPDVVQEFLESGADLEEIRLDSRGEWTHEGLDFENPQIIDLFSRSVDRTDGGTWVLKVGRFTYPITVEETGFFVEHIDLETSPPRLTLSDETTERLDPTTLEYESVGRLYCRIKGGEFRARFKRPAYYALSEAFVSEGDDVYVDLPGGRIHLADLDALPRSREANE